MISLPDGMKRCAKGCAKMCPWVAEIDHFHHRGQKWRILGQYDCDSTWIVYVVRRRKCSRLGNQSSMLVNISDTLTSFEYPTSIMLSD